MTVDRIKDWRTGDRNIVLHCDANRCAEVIDTELEDFGDALEEAKSKGWKIRKVNGVWMHFCPDEDLDGLDL